MSDDTNVIEEVGEVRGPVDVFQDFWNSRAENMHTMIPGEIISYQGHTKRKAKVKPLVKLKTRDGYDLSIPIIDNVPVQFPSSNSFSLLFPLIKGDKCALFFAETGIGNYLAGKGIEADADDVSRFSLTDCICVPGLWPFGGVPAATKFKIEVTAGNDIEIVNDTAFVHLKSTGEVNINGLARNAARQLDKINSLPTDDAAFWAWVAAVHAALQSTPANGVVGVPVPVSVTGKIIEGTDKVKLP
jgi:hypothetical protein